jgi:hypothetical protein
VSARLGFILHHFLVEHAGNALLGYWLAVFCCVLAQLLAPLPSPPPPPSPQSTASTNGSFSSRSRGDGHRRPSLSLAVWPDYHNPLLRADATTSSTSTSTSRVLSLLSRGRRVVVWALCLVLVASAVTRYLLPAVGPGWLLDLVVVASSSSAEPADAADASAGSSSYSSNATALAGTAWWLSSCLLCCDSWLARTVAPAAGSYAVAAAVCAVALHLLDNVVLVRGRERGRGDDDALARLASPVLALAGVW